MHRTAFIRRFTASALILALILTSCSLFTVDKPKATTVQSLSLSRTTLALGVGGVEYLSLSIQPAEAKKNAQVEYSYDSSVLSVSGDSSGATVSALKTGNTVLIARSNGQSAACVVTVTGIDPATENAPYITTTTPVLEMENGTTKKVIVSLSRGSSAEMAQFSWSIDKSSIATVESTGQNGIITAKTNGVARITVSHPSSTYPLEMLVFVKPDTEKAVYLTTTQNIMTLPSDGPDRKVSVSLVNGAVADELSGFTWEVLSSEESSPSCVSVTSNGANAELSPRAAGRATIRVSHPAALYPLDLKVRVVTIIENVYIEPENTKVIVNGEAPVTVKVSLKGSDRIIETDPAEFQWTIDDDSFCSLGAYQNEAILTGKKNGIAKLTVSHPAAKYSREILVFVENQIVGAINTGAFITTSQNYIRTKIGMEETELLVTLVGGERGDEKDFTWSVSNPDIISMRTTNGTIGSRSIFSQRVDGKAYIEAKSEGLAVIYISHPKVLTPTEVLVKVYPSYASFEEPLVIHGQSILGILSGTSLKATVTLQGSVKATDDALLSWKSENQSIATVSGYGNEQLITAVGNGQTFITVSHPKAENPKKILCYVASTPEELDAMKLLYSEKTFYSLVAGNTERLFISSRNIPPEELATIQWQSSNPEVASITVGESNSIGVLTGVSSGSTTVTARLVGCEPLKFHITVYPVGTPVGVLPPAMYFTTLQNVIQFKSIAVDKTASVVPVNLPLSDYGNITWVSQNPEIATVIPNGDKATITSQSTGETIIEVSHPRSENTLKLTIRIGEEYIIIPPNTPVISTSKDILKLLAEAQGEQVQATLSNNTEATGFTWAIDNPAIAAISPLDNKCFIVPKSPGQAKLTVQHPSAPYEQQVLILVSNTLEEIAGLPYLTTAQNVVRLSTGQQQTITTRLMGTDDRGVAEYVWKSENPLNSILEIVSSGSTAVITGKKSGIERISVSHTACKYPLEYICIVSSAGVDARDNPYITAPQNIISVTQGGASKNITVTLAGGLESDNADFSWSVDRGDLVQVVGNGANAVIKGLKSGEARLQIKHPKAAYPFTVVVIVDEPVPESNLYINTSHSILSMKPADASQTVSVTLVGGTAEDKYGFSWTADNYNVVDLTYSANTAIISPRAEGKSEITITHPKSPYDAKIIVRVTEYSTFAFAQNSMTIPEGTTQFITMQVPAMEGEYSGKVAYKTDNPAIVSITGTNKVAQLTALASGTATVTATSPSGAKSDMMVYVQKAAEMSAPYITSAANVLAMKITDSNRSINASIVGAGITTPDQYNLQWSIADPSVASLIGTSGPNILVKPLKGGETSITIKHPKTDSLFTIHVQVEGSTSGIIINRTYLTIETGKTVEISATIDNGTSEDYKNIKWTADKVNNTDLISIMGSGKTVGIFALSPGQTKITAELNGKKASCDVKVEASRSFVFDTLTMRVQPGQTRTFKYSLIPGDALINWITSSSDFMSYVVDTAQKTVSVTGIAEGTTKLSGTSNGIVANINIITSWDYKFSLDKSAIVAEPRYDSTQPDKFVIPYTVNPDTADVSVVLTNDTLATYVIDKSKKQITLTPRGEGTGSVLVTAKNPYNGYVFGTQTCALNLNYKSLTLIPSVISKQGKYSRYDAATQTMILGDGEDVSFKLAVAEANASYVISNVSFVKSSGNEPVTLTKPLSDMWNIAHGNDLKEYVYKKTHDMYYEVNGARKNISWSGEAAIILPFFNNGTEYGQIGLFRTAGSSYTLVTQGDCTSWSVELKSEPLPVPEYIPEATFRANRQYYLPAQTWSVVDVEGHWDWATWVNTTYKDVSCSEYFINTATRIISVDEAVKSIVLSGRITGTITRQGVSPQQIDIPVMIETRACSSR